MNAYRYSPTPSAPFASNLMLHHWPPLRHAIALACMTVMGLALVPTSHAQEDGASAPHTSATADTPAAAASPAPRRGQPVTLNFSNADIEAVARTIAIITGRNVVMDARVKGNITLQSERPIAPALAVDQFAAALRLQGFALVDADNMLKILPEADAKLQARLQPSNRPITGNRIVTRVFRLQYAKSSSLIPILSQLISPNNAIQASNAHTLVITDYADNLQRIGQIIANLDKAPEHDMEVIPLRYAIAAEIAPLVQRLLAHSDSSPTGAQAPAQGARLRAAMLQQASGDILVAADNRSNSLIMRALTRAQATMARNLILKLDQPPPNRRNGDAGNIWVVHLKNADAVKVAATLRAALAANQTDASNARPGVSVNVGNGNQAGSAQVQVTATSALQASGQPSTGGPIQADPATNSLIITASEPEYRQLRAVIDKLDTRRAQVYVESLIVEVNDKDLANLGVQWQAPHNGTRAGVLGTNFGTGGNIIGISAALANAALSARNGGTPSLPATTPLPGLNLGGMTTLHGIPVLGLLANFLQSTGSANILSTPNLVTLDNEEARIMIGQNVPFVTGQYTNNNSANGAVNPFQTIERKDVGLTLRVKPQISENGSVKMQIYQEVSSIDPSSSTTSGLITNKRSIESNVVVDDGQILVLGGLLSDQYANSQDKVPVLGDVPLLGNLFKHENRNRQKSNLMVFLRPIVMRDAAASRNLSVDRYDMMRASQIHTYPPYSIVGPHQAPILPALAGSDALWTPVSTARQRKSAAVPSPLIHQHMGAVKTFFPDGSVRNNLGDSYPAAPAPSDSY